MNEIGKQYFPIVATRNIFKSFHLKLPGNYCYHPVIC
uniref:Uncharacterized protein n=1 Tax=uncultured Desulfobacterium sp. TaxID=201089 RepID=E1YJJ3_9BACT|nr:unknown protein [uncultured Desulfobacterium sp.]